MTLIKAKNLRKEWNGTLLFEKVSFEISEGERVLLFGRNGIGKTTLLKGLIGRLLFEEEVSIMVCHVRNGVCWISS